MLFAAITKSVNEIFVFVILDVMKFFASATIFLQPFVLIPGVWVKLTLTTLVILIYSLIQRIRPEYIGN